MALPSMMIAAMHPPNRYSVSDDADYSLASPWMATRMAKQESRTINIGKASLEFARSSAFLHNFRMSLIFIVDDSSLSLNALSRLLEAEGHKVICLKESVDAADMIVEAKPDLLLLDIVMPKVSGMDILRDLKTREAMDTMPVIMVTARTGADDVRECLDAGAFDYIRKPFEPIEVLARVRSALRTHEYMEKLVFLAERDGLTGLYNHRTILHELDRSIACLKDGERSLAIVMCDIDFFKQVNDNCSHQAGDDILEGLGRLLSEALGATGQAGRYGGEEFCILLGGFDRAMASRWAETLRSVIEKREWEAAGSKLHFTMSFGVAWVDGAAPKESRALLAEADRCLYTAKKAGRNRVVVSEG
jgi:diguanylate cyclase (GGDEF)-like protein